MAATSRRAALHEGRLYVGDNGRTFCGRLPCAGASAHCAGLTLSGYRVHRLTVAEARAWQSELGTWPRCESCGRVTLSIVAGPDGWPLSEVSS